MSSSNESNWTDFDRLSIKKQQATLVYNMYKDLMGAKKLGENRNSLLGPTKFSS